LVKLEREVSLELAHARDAGPTDPRQRQQLSDAAELDSKGEQALKTGDYQTSYDDFLRARVMIRQIKTDRPL
ncbi:MAG TPA: hypothetical protein VIX12_02085, partial [Candidatus Binataceae bacterium]